ncbi:unnamed protein product [Linum tenue]|uniref:DDE Tnp4 domain-containing protein n=1 Tax=Linum tenue TaxID=586396 RepID=A0AAV0IY11_9ROSI|nr:unnamed protein product [Linum tenue]
MELAAAAAGYYYFNSLTRQPPLASSNGKGSFMTQVLDGPHELCREMFRIKSLSREFLQPAPENCIGVIDGMHIPAHVPAKDQSRFRNKKGYINMEGFIAPYPGVRYHLHEFRGANKLPRTARELFNHRHSYLRNAIQKSFDTLKRRFPILKVATQYGFQIQRDIVIAACVLHNFVRREERNDWLFASVEAVAAVEEETSDFDAQPDIMQLGSSVQEEIAFSLRESMAAAMWNDFVITWDEW